MISKKVEEAINIQIKNEEHSSRIYMAMASWCETKGYRGAADFLYKQSDEERMHMLKFIKFLNDRGGYAVLSALEVPASTYNSLLDVFNHVMSHEEFITDSINKLYEVSLNEKDYTTGNFLQWYINEQIEEESTVHGILDKMKLVGEDKAGMFHMDKDLQAMAAAKVVAPIAE
ncbi:MAG: ferritin [Lentimicrobiaceae bacterium]|nr:ferritin [Lentimicrobiaceae bacterium]MCB9023996.1 ferritin [Lentimicrobiaceae bacterium]HPG32225.1 ferritin [Lentimicrobium sp.]